MGKMYGCEDQIKYTIFQMWKNRSKFQTFRVLHVLYCLACLLRFESMCLLKNGKKAEDNLAALPLFAHIEKNSPVHNAGFYRLKYCPY